MPARVMSATTLDFVRIRYLPFEASLLEVFVGLIMVLGTTNSVAVVTLRSHYGVNALLGASFGAAVAWGVVVGTLNVLMNLFKRTKRSKVLDQVRAAPDQQSAVAVLEKDLDIDVLDLIPPEERSGLYLSIVRHVNQDHPAAMDIPKKAIIGSISRNAVIGGILIFVIRVLITLPPSIPFLFMHEPESAILVSNLISVALLFGIGHVWAGRVGLSRLRFGALIVLAGLALSAITIWLG